MKKNVAAAVLINVTLVVAAAVTIVQAANKRVI